MVIQFVLIFRFPSGSIFSLYYLMPKIISSRRMTHLVLISNVLKI
jgi:hypothetical protein